MLSVVILAALIVLMQEFDPVIIAAVAHERVVEAGGLLIGEPEDVSPRCRRSAEVETLAARQVVY